MSFSCLLPRIAIQEHEGDKPKFLHGQTDYEFYLSSSSKTHRVLLIPCGTCQNCLKRRSQEWTIRLLKEAEKHQFCYFITLTYESLYNDETGEIKNINKRDLQLFLKRYRKKFDVNLKYYICGEHGEKSGRPHYHAIFFQDKVIPDLKFYSNNLFISDTFAKCWSFGNCLISKQVNESSIKYTIAYTLKKLGEEKIVLMSKGIGLDYFIDNKERIMDHDGFYVLNGYKSPLPSYFKRKLKESSDINDIFYVQTKNNELGSSRKLSGTTLEDLFRVYKEDSTKLNLKGKGAF